MNLGKAAHTAAHFLLFADVKGFSKLDEHQFRMFHDEVIPQIAAHFDRNPAEYCNTWGDAVFAVFIDGERAVNCALDLCDGFIATRWERHGLRSDLAIRVSLHFGACHVGKNPITKRQEFLGFNVNLAARVEPIVGANQAWATDRFVAALEPTVLSHLYTHSLGERELVKGWGTQTLYRLSRHPIDPKTVLAGSTISDPHFPILGIHHINLPVTNLERSVRFYHDVLRLRQADDPEIMDEAKRRLPFGFPGAWFHFPNGQQLHLIPRLANVDPPDPPVTLRETDEIYFKDVHFAMSVRDYDIMYQLLIEEQKNGKVKIVLGPMKFQIYVCDPDNHIIEITSVEGPKANDC